MCFIVFRLQEEIKKSKQLSDELSSSQQQLKEKTTLSEDLQRSLVSLKEELSTSLVRFEQTKRHLEDQLIDEERAREDMQEQNLEFRKTNKKLVKELEALQKDPSKLQDRAREKGGDASSGSQQQKPGGMSAAEVKGLMRKRLDDLQCQLEWSQMQENDLLGLLRRQEAARVSAQAKPAPVRRMLSRMPSTTVITRFVPNANHGAVRADPNARNGALALGGEIDNESFDEQGDRFDDDGLGGGDPNGFDEKNFEAHTQEVHRMLTEIEEGRNKNQKLQKTIAVRWALVAEKLNMLRARILTISGVMPGGDG